jgi:two-component system phosphate regulon sensor histidine kinase PhoR
MVPLKWRWLFDKRKVLIRISDNGEGIDKQNIGYLNVLSRQPKRFTIRGGSGLGLAIVKHIIREHKEKIYVESELGVGSEFSLHLKGKKNI